MAPARYPAPLRCILVDSAEHGRHQPQDASQWTHVAETGSWRLEVELSPALQDRPTLVTYELAVAMLHDSMAAALGRQAERPLRLLIDSQQATFSLTT